jgi:ankyrin repeat protein
MRADYPAAIDALEEKLAGDPDDAEAVIRLGFNLWFAVVENDPMMADLPVEQYAERFMDVFHRYEGKLGSNGDFCWAFGLGMSMFSHHFPGATEEMGKRLIGSARELDPFWARFGTQGISSPSMDEQAARFNGRGIFEGYYLQTEAVEKPDEIPPAVTLHGAARMGSARYVEMLLARGADVNARNRKGFTPLHEAAGPPGDAAMVGMLLGRGAEIEARDDAGNTPLHLAAEPGESGDIARLLLERGADPNAANNLGCRPIHLAAAYGSKDILEALIAHGADVNAADREGLRPLHMAVTRESTDVVEVLLAHGADVNARGIHGETPLHNTVFFVGDEDPERLLAGGAGVDTGDASLSDRMKGFFLNSEVATLLLARGADPDARDHQGNTPRTNAEALLRAMTSGVEHLLASEVEEEDDEDDLRPVYRNVERIVELMRRYSKEKPK